MKNKLWFVSIAAVILMVLASCNSVVGSEETVESLELEKLVGSLDIDVDEIQNSGEMKTTLFFFSLFLYMVVRLGIGLINLIHTLVYGYPVIPVQ